MIVTMMNAAIMIRSFISNRREVSLRWLGASEQVARGRGEGGGREEELPSKK